MRNRLLYRVALTSILSLFLFACGGRYGAQSSATTTPNTQELTEAPLSGEENVTDNQLDLTGPQPEWGETLTWVDGNLLVYIPPGEFVMGFGGDDNPEHLAYLDGFWIYRTEVTNSMYLRCMAMEKCSPPAFDPALPDIEDPAVAELPVVGVRWDQAENYCRFVDGFLPTEAQWEKTARGPEGNIYPWGNAEPNCDLLNFKDCLGKTSSVIAYPTGASPYEVFDMAGNVFEWVADWYKPGYYTEAPVENPMGPEVGEVRSVRGSAFNSGPDQIASAIRYFLGPDEYRIDLGFRCVVANAQRYAPPCEVLAHLPPDTQGEPGEAPGGSASCIVPQPELSVITFCQNRIRGNNISWTPADAEMNYSAPDGISCSMYDADTLVCSGVAGATVDVEVCRSCPPPAVDLGVPASCDPSYVLDEPAGICRYDGPPIPGVDLCTPGFALRENVCCDMEDYSPHDFPTCPIGGVYDPMSRICWFRLPSTGDVKCASQAVYFESCRRSGGNGDGDGGQPLSCSDYPDQNTCEANGCYWYCFQTGQFPVCNCINNP